MPERVTTLFMTCAALLLAGASTAHALSARKLISQGNAAYQSGKYAEALQSYDEASIDAPESPTIHFNRGAVHYRQEDYEKAREAFEQAALKSVEPKLESRARYNLGNCAFREAERQRDSDLKKALKSCEEAIRHYQEALDNDRDLRRAAENIEIVRLYMKALLDEINKQKEEQQQEQEQKDDLAKKLKALIERQRQALATNHIVHAQSQRATAAAQTNLLQRIESLSMDQQGIHKDTQEVSDEVRQNLEQTAQAPQGQSGQMPPMPQAGGAQSQTTQPGGQNPSPSAPSPGAAQHDQATLEKLTTVKEHVDKAIGQQAQAMQQLIQKRLPPAQPHQKTAEEELVKALEALQDEGDQQQQQQQQQQEEGDEEQEQEQEKKEQENEQGSDEGQEEEQRMQAAKAEDILQEEKDNREKRQPVQVRGGRPVDKNW